MRRSAGLLILALATSAGRAQGDRLTGRWFVLAVNTPSTNNRVLIAWTAP